MNRAIEGSVRMEGSILTDSSAGLSQVSRIHPALPSSLSLWESESVK